MSWSLPFYLIVRTTRRAFVFSCVSIVSMCPAIAQDSSPFTSEIGTPEALVTKCLQQAAAGEVTQDNCIGTYTGACVSTAFTTADMVGCVSSEAEVWEARMSAAYEVLLDVYGEQDADEDKIWALAPRLETLQDQWADWRAAKCGFAYAKFRGGSMGRITGANCHLDETANRVFELEILLEEARL